MRRLSKGAKSRKSSVSPHKSIPKRTNRTERPREIATGHPNIAEVVPLIEELAETKNRGGSQQEPRVVDSLRGPPLSAITSEGQSLEITAPQVLVEIDPHVSTGFVNDRCDVLIRGRVVASCPISMISLQRDGMVICETRYGRPIGGQKNLLPEKNETVRQTFVFNLPRLRADAKISSRFVIEARTLGDFLHQETFTLAVDLHDPLKISISSGPTWITGDAKKAPIILNVERVALDTDSGQLLVRGWAVSETAIKAIDVRVGERPIGSARLRERRDDVAKAIAGYPAAGRSGFSASILLGAGRKLQVPATVRVQVVCFNGIVQEAVVPVEHAGGDTRPSSDVQEISGTIRRRRGPESDQAEQIVGVIDNITETGVRGWALNPDSPRAPLSFDARIDSKVIASVRCDIVRPDIRGAGHPTDVAGFEFPIPRQYLDGDTHLLEFCLPEGTPLPLTKDGVTQTSFSFSVPRIVILGQVDGWAAGAIRGWIAKFDRTKGVGEGRQNLLITNQGHPIAQIKADQLRPDVASGYGCDPQCGFSFVPTIERALGKSWEFRFFALPERTELKNSPLRIDFFVSDTYKILHDLIKTADSLFTQIWDLKQRITDLVPAPSYNILSYDLWAVQYFANIRTPCEATNRLTQEPLISIICPTYKPRLRDFRAAVESILAQTYKNWELIVVDDASGSADLEACIRGFAEGDKRIKPIFLTKNGGISAATNRALKVARGRYVAFFDHDDLLESRALELMTATALGTKAKILYCDEDKIDDDGRLSEVHLKPAWNYRLMLAQNYLCHLLFVERSLLLKAGPLRSEYDGAQDHALILRLSEFTVEADIVHVPEILYHWRKTPFSTAASTQSKTYAVNAGIRAISDHLKRKGLQAEVRSLLDTTIYEVHWIRTESPKVTIIVPYREHITMTEDCLSSILSITDYENYEVMLVDNWSSSKEAEDFANRASKSKKVTVLRAPYEFNFSRLNNDAAARSSGDFVLFLNNDVLITDPRWLRAMVDEALVDSRVGIVGNKLLYPENLVQHGGVVLGVGGIADHAHRGLRADEAGYMGRAICAQEVSAVTAACMLCRRDVFNAVGGFDEADLQVAFNDVDLCLKIRSAGYRVIWTPASVAVHRESMSRGSDFSAERRSRFFYENKVMEDRWKNILDKDPFYNVHFSRRGGLYRDLAEP